MAHVNPENVHPEQAREALNVADSARKSFDSANNLPLAGLLISTGATATTVPLLVAVSEEFPVVGFVFAMALLIPGFTVYTRARSWSKTDSPIFFSVIGGQLLGFLAGIIGWGAGAPSVVLYVGAGVSLVATTVGMLALMKRGK